MRIPLLSSRPALPEPVGSGLDALRGRAQGAAAEAVEVIGPRLDAARETLAPRLAEAAEKTSQLAGQLAEEARELALPKIEAAREQAVSTVRKRVLPRVSKTIADAAAASEPAREEAKKRGEAAMAAIRGDVPSRRRRWPRAIMLMGAGAVAGAAAGLMAGRRESASPGLDAYSPMSGGDPYARTEPSTTGLTGAATTSPPATPVPPKPAPVSSAPKPTPPSPTPTPTPPSGDSTIDVTDEPVALTSDSEANPTSATKGKPRRTQP